MSQQTIQIPKIPPSIEAFGALQAQLAQTPEGGAALMVLALLLYSENAALGQACLALAVDANRLQPGAEGYGGQQLQRRELALIRTQITGQGHLPRSYIAGATPENGYALPEPPYTITTSRNPYSGDEAAGQVKCFVASSGAASPRPVTLRRDAEGLWKASEWSSLLSGIRNS